MRLGRSNLGSNLERLLCLRSWEADGKGDVTDAGMVVVMSVATSVVTDDGSGGRDGCREECRDGRRSRNEKEVRGW